MSLMKAAITGFADAGARVANKYLDEQLAKDRAEFMAQLQRRTAGEIRADDFAFKTDPTRVQATRDIAAGDVKAQAGAKRAAEMEGWTDTEYQAARDAQTEKDMKADAKRMSLLERAKVRTGGGGGADPLMKLPPAVKESYLALREQAKNISAAITKSQADGTWEPDKNKSQGDLMLRMRVLEDKAQDLLKPYIPKPKGQQGASPDDDIRKLLMGEGVDTPAAPGAAPAGASKPRAEQPVDPQREAMSLQQRWKADAVAREQKTQGNTRAAAQGINSSAQQALRARDPAAAQEVMDSPSFNLLDQATKTAVRNLVYGK